MNIKNTVFQNKKNCYLVFKTDFSIFYSEVKKILFCYLYLTIVKICL